MRLQMWQVILTGTLFYVLQTFYRYQLFLCHQQQQQPQDQKLQAPPRPREQQANQATEQPQERQQAEELETTETRIRDYVDQAVHVKAQLALLYWNSSGHLDISPLMEQCEFRNFTEAGLWPFYLSNTRIDPQQAPKLALYPTSDLNSYYHYNWSIPSPIPLLAHSLPLEIVEQMTTRYNHWIHFLPTPYELRGDGRRWVHRVIHMEGPPSQVPFSEKKSQIVYRANHNSQKYHLKHQRSKVMEMGDNPDNHHWLNATKTYPNPGLSQRDQLWFKYLLDVGGLSGTTWTALRWKLCAGTSLVFKVDSGYADWWYHGRLKPFEHYVPVKADLSDLKQQYDWAEAHPDEVQRIIQAGQEVCLQTNDREYMRAFVKKQIESLPSPTMNQLVQYYELLDDSRRRLHHGQPAMLFERKERFKREPHSCPPQLKPENA